MSDNDVLDYCLGDSDIPVETVPHTWNADMRAIYLAASEVRDAIEKYSRALREASNNKIPSKVRELVLRGCVTAQAEDDKWSCLQDDPYVINSKFVEEVKKGWRPTDM